MPPRVSRCRIAGFDLFIGGMSLDSARTPVETGPREARYDTSVEAVRGLAAWLVLNGW